MIAEYLQPSNPYFGSTIGRYANTIRDGTFVVRPSGKMYMVSTNRGHHHYHGGRIGFDKVDTVTFPRPYTAESFSIFRDVCVVFYRWTGDLTWMGWRWWWATCRTGSTKATRARWWRRSPSRSPATTRCALRCVALLQNPLLSISLTRPISTSPDTWVFHHRKTRHVFFL